MTSEPVRFPIGLTLAAAVVIAICCGLGVWQLGRAQWKAQMLAEIAARRASPALPIEPVLQRARAGEDVSFTRVTADCGASGGASFKPSTQNGEWVWRAIVHCRLAGGPFRSIAVDRGILVASRGSTSAPTVMLAAPRAVTGILQPISPRGSDARPGEPPYLLVAERETPPLAGVIPSPGVNVAGESLQYVGSYAPTWFGLAGVAACFYAAMLWRRRRPKR